MRVQVSITIFLFITISNCYQDCSNVNEEWNLFKLKYGKSYRNNNEELYRKRIFLTNLREICEHNEKFKKNLETYEKGVNIFADMEFEEFKRTHLGFNSQMMKLSSPYSIPYESFSRRSETPTYINWVENGGITSVKRQGLCGACYAFSAIGSVEAQLYRKFNKLIELSAQQIVDCSINYGNEGCDSGIMSQAFDYMTDYGIESDVDYPYVGKMGICTYNESKIITKLRGFIQLPPGDENILMKAVSQIGPIAAAMEVTNNTRQFVGKSIFYDRLCHRNSNFLNHAVLIVGYGSVNGNDYWLIKNSWGDSFGDAGYAKIARNSRNHCNIATDVSFPVL